MPARSAVIEIPMLPPREVSPNFHGSWRKRAEAAQLFRVAAGWATLVWADAAHRASLVGGDVVMDVEIAWCCGRRTLDDDNAWASLKAARDGIADVLFLGEDRCMAQGTLTQTRGKGVVTVTLTGREGG